MGCPTTRQLTSEWQLRGGEDSLDRHHVHEPSLGQDRSTPGGQPVFRGYPMTSVQHRSSEPDGFARDDERPTRKPLGIESRGTPE